MDEFLNGWVQQRFTDNYNIIAAAAKKDNAKWNGGPPALGYKCVLTHRFRAGSPKCMLPSCGNHMTG
jgi:hypothetical protein